MEELSKAMDYLEMALGGNMNTETLTPLAISEVMEDYHKNKLKLLGVNNVINSFTEKEVNESYNQGFRDGCASKFKTYKL